MFPQYQIIVPEYFYKQLKQNLYAKINRPGGALAYYHQYITGTIIQAKSKTPQAG